MPRQTNGDHEGQEVPDFDRARKAELLGAPRKRQRRPGGYPTPSAEVLAQLSSAPEGHCWCYCLSCDAWLVLSVRRVAAFLQRPVDPVEFVVTATACFACGEEIDGLAVIKER